MIAEGRLVANTIDRHGFTSEEIVRDIDGQVHDHDRAARAPRQLAADRRDRAIRPGVAPLRHADRRRDADHEGRADAGGHAKGLLMIRVLLWILGAILLGGIVHLCDRAGDAEGGDAGRLFAARAADAGQCHGAAHRADRRDRNHAVHGSGVCRSGVPVRSFRRIAQAQRAGEPSLYVGHVLHAQQRRLLCDQ